MKLKDVKIGKKLLMAFGVVELLMIALIIMGVTATNSMNGRLEQIVSSNDAMIEAAYDLKGAINSINLRTLGSFASKDEAHGAHMAEVVTENRNKYSLPSPPSKGSTNYRNSATTFRTSRRSS